jgi:hypothetical protein
VCHGEVFTPNPNVVEVKLTFQLVFLLSSDPTFKLTVELLSDARERCDTQAATQIGSRSNGTTS